jgi:hypothetical protein
MLCGRAESSQREMFLNYSVLYIIILSSVCLAPFLSRCVRKKILTALLMLFWPSKCDCDDFGQFLNNILCVFVIIAIASEFSKLFSLFARLRVSHAQKIDSPERSSYLSHRFVPLNYINNKLCTYFSVIIIPAHFLRCTFHLLT